MRDQSILIRVSANEAETIRRNAAADGLSVSAYIRQRATTAPTPDNALRRQLEALLGNPAD